MSVLKGAAIAKSIDDLRRQAAGGTRSGRSAQLFVKPDSSVKIRFLQEPTEFMEFQEHYDGEQRMFVPAIDNDPLDRHPNEKTRQVSRRWIANVLNIEDGRVHIIKLNPDMVNRLLTRYQRNGTLRDRNYELIRTGAGRDTKYDIDHDDPTQMDLARYQDRLWDLEEYLLGEVDAYHNTTYQEDYRREREGNGTPPADLQRPPAGTEVDPEAAKAQAAAQKIAELDEKYGEEPPWSDSDGTDEKTPPITGEAQITPPPTSAAPAPGMAEIAAETEAATATLTAVPDSEPTAALDPWEAAKANGQPCVKGEKGTCVICGFDVSACLMKPS